MFTQIKVSTRQAPSHPPAAVCEGAYLKFNSPAGSLILQHGNMFTVWHDPETGQIGLHPCPEADPEGRKYTKVRPTGPRGAMSATVVTKHYADRQKFSVEIAAETPIVRLTPIR